MVQTPPHSHLFVISHKESPQYPTHVAIDHNAVLKDGVHKPEAEYVCVHQGTETVIGSAVAMPKSTPRPAVPVNLCKYTQESAVDDFRYCEPKPSTETASSTLVTPASLEAASFSEDNAYRTKEDASALPRPSITSKDGNDVPCESQTMVLVTRSGAKVHLPVGIELTPTFWKTQNYENKKAIADHFKCDTIEKFEQNILFAWQANTSNDADIAASIAVEETRLVLLFLLFSYNIHIQCDVH